VLAGDVLALFLRCSGTQYATRRYQLIQAAARTGPVVSKYLDAVKSGETMADHISEQHELGRNRMIQVFEYLKALNEHRNPATCQIGKQLQSLWLDDLPHHPAITLSACRKDGAREGDKSECAADGDLVLRVRRPKLTNAPSPPPELLPWLCSDWQEPETDDIQCRESRNEPDENGQPMVVHFADNPFRPELLDDWRRKRDQWRANELPARRAMEIFEWLYELHGRIEREGESVDLVVGDGILSWRRPDESIYHPVLVQRVQLAFDPQVPEFTVTEGDGGTELCTSPLQSVPDVDPQTLGICRIELEKGDYHPLADASSAFLRRFAVSLSSHGEFTDKGRPAPESEFPRIGRSPVLFLRARTLGFSRAIDRVLDRLRLGSNVCPALRNVVGVESAPVFHDEATAAERTSEHPRNNDFLFGKAANAEQIQIAQRLEKHGSVLVQGPPGTGKTHTIANLIGHLLAHGKSVLVTSHTAKALHVLRQYIPKELRPLCVSVLESDLAGREQLKESIQAIADRLGQLDTDSVDQEAIQLDDNRRRMTSRLEELQTDLLNARTTEYRDLVLSGKSISPLEAAQMVAAGRGKHDWIPGPVAFGEPCPLSSSELKELYATNTETSPDDDTHIARPLPALGDLLPCDDFEEAMSFCNTLAEPSLCHDDPYWKETQFTTQHLHRLDVLVNELKKAVSEIRAMEPWQLAAIDAGRSENGRRAPWDHLLGRIEIAARTVSDAELAIVTHAPDIAASQPLNDQLQHAQEIGEYLRSGKSLTPFALTFHPTWKKAVRSWHVRREMPKTADHFCAIEKALKIEIACHELAAVWDVLMVPRGLHPFEQLGERPAAVCSQYRDRIEKAVRWWNQRWSPLIENLKELGFDWDRFVSQQPPLIEEHGEMIRIINAVEYRLLESLAVRKNHLRALQFKHKLRQAMDRLSHFDRAEVRDVQNAIKRNDVHGYLEAYARLESAIDRQQYAIRRSELLVRLEQHSSSGVPIAEAWAHHLRHRIGPHGQKDIAGDPIRAWEWRQMNDELNRRNCVSLEELNTQIEHLQQRLNETTVQLIDRRAWAGQVRRTSLQKRQTLIGWLDTVRRIGRGYGKRNARLKIEARKKMSDCRDAVPVWIMPLARVVESFDFRDAQFDVVIIDEASQCNVLGLLPFAIAKQVIIVGDHEQVSPSAVGQTMDVVSDLIETHLRDIPNKDLYDGKMSVYDLARQSFGGTICLREHFRSVPDIIQFSNHLAYGGNIKPLRDDTSSPFQRHVIAYRVDAATRNGKVNREEALTVASLVAATIEHPAYESQSLGVISLLGEDQAREIERLLHKHVAAEQFKSRRIVCGNSAHFQGDERDVMFLSLVDIPRGEPLPIRQDVTHQQRFNVAASRARNQMWVVYSLSPKTDLKPGDLRKRLIEHALAPKALIEELDSAEARAESPFEQQVIRRLVEAGYDVTPQWKVGGYRIDIVVKGSQARLAVECDGERFHPIEKLKDDLARQAILERLGWTFHRIRGSDFYRHPDQAMKALFAKLAAMRIEPVERNFVEKPLSPADPDPISEEIKRRASEIRAGWAQEDQEAMMTTEIRDDDGNDSENNGGHLRLFQSGAVCSVCG